MIPKQSRQRNMQPPKKAESKVAKFSDNRAGGIEGVASLFQVDGIEYVVITPDAAAMERLMGPQTRYAIDPAKYRRCRLVPIDPGKKP